jgi:formylglycine-generating enzyme required for sulfatase activity
MTSETSTKRFRIAFSFAGEKREFVKATAEILAEKFGEDKILYDKFHEAEFARFDLGIYLPKLYSEQSNLIVSVLCANYDQKRWTGWEWVHIYGLLTKADGYRVIHSRFDYANADGLSHVAGFVELDEKTPEQFATLILQRLAINEGKSKDYYTKNDDHQADPVKPTEQSKQSPADPARSAKPFDAVADINGDYCASNPNHSLWILEGLDLINESPQRQLMQLLERSDVESCVLIAGGRRYSMTKSMTNLQQRPLWASKFGRDSLGIFAEMMLSTEKVKANQTLRWIEPGTFWMGSPEDEPGRYSNEGPRHKVTISQGFWLADSACTQALWQAVMDNNPSRFNDDPQQPVENVSWDDVQAFLKRLESLLPGCQVDLPSEAEWEYACRAGKTTPFSFGAKINTQQVNYNGNYPYFGDKKGEYREKTVPVKSLPANPWGLYEMHGNVWEWCKDGRRTYDGQAQIDPVGSMLQAQPRVLRGGAWNSNAWRARSASRGAAQPGSARDFVGFRFCLRSIQPGQAG